MNRNMRAADVFPPEVFASAPLSRLEANRAYRRDLSEGERQELRDARRFSGTESSDRRPRARKSCVVRGSRQWKNASDEVALPL